MATRKIRFDLPIDGTKVRTLEQLREHFHHNELLAHFREGLLLRWLDVCGFTKELEELRNLPAGMDDLDAFKNLARIFQVEIDKDPLQDQLTPSIYQYGQNYMVKEYQDILRQVEQNKDNNEFVQATVRHTLGEHYWDLIAKDPEAFVSWSYEKAPLALLSALMHEERLRGIIFPSLQKQYFHKHDAHEKSIALFERVRHHTISYKGSTGDENYWQDIIPRTTRIMLVHLTTDGYILSDSKQIIGHKSVNLTYPILHGYFAIYIHKSEQSIHWIEVLPL